MTLAAPITRRRVIKTAGALTIAFAIEPAVFAAGAERALSGTLAKPRRLMPGSGSGQMAV